jgi:hypothetical protein
MPSQEMLKKLLDEFVEKEQLVNEELKVITEEIEQLEMRLEVCRARLGTIGADRDRVVQLKQKYANGDYRIDRSQAAAQPQPHAQPQPQPKVQPKPVVQEAAKPVHETPMPVHETPMPVHETPKPVHETPKPVHEMPKPVHEMPKPVHETPKPVQEPPRPVVQEPPTPVVQQEEPAAVHETGHVFPVFSESPSPVSPAVAQEKTLPQVSDPVTAALSGAEAQKKTLTGINQLLGARKNQTSPVAFSGETQDYQQQLPTPGEPTEYGNEPQWIPGQGVGQSAQNDQTAPQQEDEAPPQQATITEPEAQSEESESDTVKSINDALRSLFR